MQAPVVNITAVKAFIAARDRKSTPADTASEDFASTTFKAPVPLTALQQDHADKKARARKIAYREGIVCSAFDLGEVIARMEDEANVAWGAHDTTTGTALGKFARELKQLIPALREPLEAKACPHCKAPASVKEENGRHYVGCSNRIACHGWPQTQNHGTRNGAVDAWNNDEMR